MKWSHDFYQTNPDINDGFSSYRSQREARAILELVRPIKNGYYEAKVIAIESNEPFRFMTVAGGCMHQYKIGDIFTLRRHKNKKGHTWFCDSSERFWYDPRFKSKNFGERFILIE